MIRRFLVVSAFALGIFAAPITSAQTDSIQVISAETIGEQEALAPNFSPPKRLASIASRKCDIRTESGLGYSVLQKGDGTSPSAQSRVRVAYAGYFLSNGAQFDSSDSASFGVGGVIPGFGEGLQLMQRGSEYRICIPPQLGYGARGAGNRIPPNSYLVFYLKLLDF